MAPLRVLPGTHTLGVLSDDAVHELATHATPLDCVVPKGGVVIMRPPAYSCVIEVTFGNAETLLHIEYAASDSIASPLQLAVA
jgi:hypothetical protein